MKSKLLVVAAMALVCLGLVYCSGDKGAPKDAAQIVPPVAPSGAQPSNVVTAPGSEEKKCNSDTDCMTGQICVTETQQCIAKPQGECESDQDCAVDETCDSATKHCLETGNGASTFSDGVKNGDETDVDCGGTNPHKCGIGASCGGDTDCSVAGKCENGSCASKLQQACPGNPGGTCIELLPAKVKTTQPKDNTVKWGTGFSGTFAIKATFNQPMDAASITDKTFVVKKSGSDSMAKGAVVLIGNNDVALYAQNKDLEPNTEYTATITTGAKTKTGQNLAEDYSWNFTTANAVDKVTPKRDAHELDTTLAEIRVRFAGDIPADAFSKGSIEIKPAVAIKDLKHEGNDEIVFRLAEELADEKTYTVTLKKSGVLADDYIWNFSTANCPDPELELTWLQKTCFYNIYDCEGGGCEPGFWKGDIVVTGGIYMMQWKSKNTDYVVDECHDYTKKVKYSGDGGVVTFPWDGPKPGQGEPTGFTPIWAKYLSDAIAGKDAHAAGGNAEVGPDRKPGKFECTVRAQGVCGKNLYKKYHYSCP